MKKLLATLLIVFAGPSLAQWVMFENTDDGNARVFYDPSKIRGAEIKRVWLKVEFSKPRDDIRSMRMLQELNCVSEQGRLLQVTAFEKADLDGLGSTDNSPGAWSYIAPDTVESSLFTLVCRKKK